MSGAGKIIFTILIGLEMIACGNPASPPLATSQYISSTLSTTTQALEQLNKQISESSIVDGHPSKIIGINPLVPVKVDGSNIDEPFRNLIDALGLMAITGQGACTATHLGNGYVLTAGHCFFGETEFGVATSSSLNQKYCDQAKIYWGYRGSQASGDKFPVISSVSQCTKLVYAERSEHLDFAIFQVDKVPGVKVSLSTSPKRPKSGTKITILGFPNWRPLEWSQYCSLVRGNKPALGFTSPANFIYQCDTEPGNSGSTILTVDAKKNVEIIGVHDGAAPDGVNYNYASYLYDIRNTLQKNGFKLDEAVAVSAQAI